MSTMKAIRFHGNQDLRYDEIPVAKVGPNQVKIAPEWCGLCGSGSSTFSPRYSILVSFQANIDLHEYLEGPHYSPTGPHPITGEDLPRTFGHEFAGKVVEVGSSVTDLVKGDNVCVYPLLFDGTCSRCLSGCPNICEQLGFYGISGWGGGLSEAVSVDRKKVYKLPEGMSTDLGGIF
jgi:threonine dehydrogenase-like Zn-dependent dehydrogenase